MFSEDGVAVATARSNGVASSLRYQADRRQFGALLMLTGMCAITQSLAGIATAIGPNGTTPIDPNNTPLWSFIGGLCINVIGIGSVICGYLETVHDYGNRNIMIALSVFTQTAFIPYITGMTGVGKASSLPATENVFIPQAYSPTDKDVKFVGAMGILTILAYGFTFVGSIAFMQFSLIAFRSGKPEDRDGKYFRGRMGFYCIMLCIAGISQLSLGSYVHTHLDGGTSLDYGGSISVAMIHIHFPAIAVAMGLIQVLNGIWGLVRSYGHNMHGGPMDNMYVKSIIIQWFLMLTLQIMTQISYAPGGVLAPAAPTIASMMFGLNVMPAFLDYKMRTMPTHIPPGFYNAATTTIVDTEIAMVLTDNVEQQQK